MPSKIFKRKTKIIATLGPASETPAVLIQLIKSGLDIARLNFSHGTHAEQGKRFKHIRALSQKLKKPIVIMGDLQGPKMRLGKLAELQVRKGDTITLNTSISEQVDERLPFPSPVFSAGTKKGDHIFINDGLVSGDVVKAAAPLFRVKIVKGGEISSHKGVNAPNLHLRSTILEEKDLADLKFLLSLSVDWIAMSFVRTADDIRELCNLCKGAKKKPKIIAKIERPEAITNIKEILKEVDGIMVARGDLGVETPIAQLPLRQKELVAAARKAGKFVIVATQMMESMIHHPSPTRAEVSDVANAVFDGADAVMLSAETSKGHYPLETVEMMRDILVETENHLRLKKR